MGEIKSQRTKEYLSIQKNLSNRMIRDIKDSFDNYQIGRLEEITDIHFEVANNVAKIAESDARERAIKAFTQVCAFRDERCGKKCDCVKLKRFLNHYDNE